MIDTGATPAKMMGQSMTRFFSGQAAKERKQKEIDDLVDKVEQANPY